MINILQRGNRLRRPDYCHIADQWKVVHYLPFFVIIKRAGFEKKNMQHCVIHLQHVKNEENNALFPPRI